MGDPFSVDTLSFLPKSHLSSVLHVAVVEEAKPSLLPGEGNLMQAVEAQAPLQQAQEALDLLAQMRAQIEGMIR